MNRSIITIIWLPSRELTYPTWGKRKIIFKKWFLMWYVSYQECNHASHWIVGAQALWPQKLQAKWRVELEIYDFAFQKSMGFFPQIPVSLDPYSLMATAFFSIGNFLFLTWTYILPTPRSRGIFFPLCFLAPVPTMLDAHFDQTLRRLWGYLTW